ncbi:MAG: NERD domain-containing protein [Chitinophagaceae bacterium]|nr:MAG: NERD domain-containing protein [Chitinophagaceae bacterium]
MDDPKRSKPLDPVKMGLYEIAAEDFGEQTWDERVAEIRNIGRKASLDFAEKYASLNSWFKEYDALYLLSFCKNYFVVTEEGHDEEAEKGHLEFPPYFLEILQAFALAQRRSISGKPLLDDVYTFKQCMREIGDLSILKMFDIPQQLASLAQVNAYKVRMEMMAHTTAVRNWAYHHQMLKVTGDLAREVKDEFNSVHGFCPEAFLNLLNKLAHEVENKLNIHAAKVRKALRQTSHIMLMEEYERQFPGVKSSGQSQKENIWERAGKDLESLRGMFLAHSDLRLEEIFTFSINEIVLLSNNAFTKEKVLKLFNELSLSFGDINNLNQDFFILDNPVHQKPFIKLSDDEFYTSLWGILPHLSIGLLESFISKNAGLIEIYNKRKGAYLENQLYELAKKSFPSGEIYKSVKWQLDNHTQFENDLLIILPPFVLVIEAKSGSITPAAKRGAPDRLTKTLKQLVEEPSDQALRFIEQMKGKTTITIETENQGKTHLDTTKLQYFIPLGVTLSHLGIISTNLKLLIEGELTDKKIYQLAPSISFTDLEHVFDLLPLEASKLHYLQRRREFELHVDYAADELDLLAFYLENGFNIGNAEYSKEYRFNLLLKSKEIDPFIINTAQGFVCQKPEPNLTQWWKDILKQLSERKPPNWLETSYILLNFMKEEQEQLEQSLKAMVREILEGKLTHKHNWVIGSTVNEQRKFIMIVYPYLSKYRNERDGMMSDIIESNYKPNIKGIVILAINIEKAHYPYSVFCSTLSPQLFESHFTEMIKYPK